MKKTPPISILKKAPRYSKKIYHNEWHQYKSIVFCIKDINKRFLTSISSVFPKRLSNNADSVNYTEIGSFRNYFRRLEMTERKVKWIKEWEDSIWEAVNNNSYVETSRKKFGYRISIMSSKLWDKKHGNKIQDAHIDFREVDLGKHNDLFLAFMPITGEGSHIHLWPSIKYYTEENKEVNKKMKGDVFFIPFGCMLIIPADIPHAGGYRWSNDFPYNRISVQVTRNTDRIPLSVDHSDGKKITLGKNEYKLNEVSEFVTKKMGYLNIIDTYAKGDIERQTK